MKRENSSDDIQEIDLSEEAMYQRTFKKFYFTKKIDLNEDDCFDIEDEEDIDVDISDDDVEVEDEEDN
jgi:hypothetical protein